MSRRPYADQRKSYAIFRMSEAIDRMIRADTAEGKRRAARWAAAWGLAGGGPNSGKVKLRKRD